MGDETREGMPWMPEEDLLALVEGMDEGGLPPRAVEAYEAIKMLRNAAIGVVATFESSGDIAGAIAELNDALLAGVTPDE